LAPVGAGDAPTIVHCSFYIVHCWTFTFSAKERDSETGLSYFGSRYYSSDLSIWLSVDPQAAKYASLSPYTYCANNPVRLVDPNGEEVWIVGDGTDCAFEQLQNQTGLVLSLSVDGKLSYTGKAETEIDKMIANAIDDENITVNMIANISNSFGDVKTEVGGGYMGNTYEDGHVCTDQFVCTSLLADLDYSVGDAKTGLSMVHELAESYYGGQIALQRKESSPVSGDGCSYDEAHRKANKIAVGNYGPVDASYFFPGVSYRFNKPGDDIHRMRNGVLDYIHIYVRIGWVRKTDNNGM
jgi:RHS repeat-associated protein